MSQTLCCLQVRILLQVEVHTLVPLKRMFLLSLLRFPRLFNRLFELAQSGKKNVDRLMKRMSMELDADEEADVEGTNVEGIDVDGTYATGLDAEAGVEVDSDSF